MLQVPLFQVDAFTTRLFGGNPAAVCPLEHWLPDELMQAIAAENNLSETAFLLREEPALRAAPWRLRWFTPAMEVDLCGHATLASGHVVLEHLEPGLDRVRFETRSGPLTVRRRGAELELDLPAWEPHPCEPPEGLVQGLGLAPAETYESGPDYFLAVLADEAAVRGLRPDLAALETLERFGVVATAPGAEVDFVSRFFAPRAGVPEDPVTGSAHCGSAPYWARRLGRERLRARQLSRRGGELGCEVRGERVLLSGTCVPYLEGRITLP